MATILVIEDDVITLKVLQLKLKVDNHTIIERRDGRNVDKIINDHDIDFFITDLNLPFKSGEEIINEIIQLKPDAKIIITSMNSKENISPDLLDKVGWFIQKPYTSEEFEHLKYVLKAL